jgi:hypothetical protein
MLLYSSSSTYAPISATFFTYTITKSSTAGNGFSYMRQLLSADMADARGRRRRPVPSLCARRALGAVQRKKMAAGGASRAARLAAQLAAAVDSSSAAAIKCGCASASCNCASSAVKSRPGTERRRRLARSWLQLSEPVQAALRAGRAVVALESTIISHGMPYPQNLQTAIEVEAVVQR